jgi:hypothetical protein
MADDDVPADVTDAAHAAIGGVQSALSDLVDRVDRLAEAQAQTLQEVIKLRPVAAVEAEVAGATDALDPNAHDPPAAAPNEPERVKSPLRRIHEAIG